MNKSLLLTKLPMLTRYTACWPYHFSLGSPMSIARCTIPARRAASSVSSTARRSFRREQKAKGCGSCERRILQRPYMRPRTPEVHQWEAYMGVCR